MADHAIVAAAAPRNDTTHLNTKPDSVRDSRRNTPDDDPVSRYWTAFDAFNADEIVDAEYMAAFPAMHIWNPSTAYDFVRKFQEAYSVGGHPNGENEKRLISQAVALLGGERSGREG